MNVLIGNSKGFRLNVGDCTIAVVANDFSKGYFLNFGKLI